MTFGIYFIDALFMDIPVFYILLFFVWDLRPLFLFV